MEQWSLFVAALVQSVAQAAPYVVIGYIVAAVVREFVSMDTMHRWFAARGWRGIATAGGVGALLPLCSCTVIPLGVGLVRAGAARGTILTFMTSAPAVSPVALILSLSLLGPTLTAIYVGTVLVGAMLLGIIANRLLIKSETAFHEQYSALAPTAEQSVARSFFQRIRQALKWAFWDLGAEISVDLCIGLTLAAVVLAILPMAWIATWLGEQQLMTLLYVIIIGIPVYTCSVPSLPVVHSLLLAGMSPGAAIAYLIAGPATNLGELLVLKRQFGGLTMSLFLGGLFVMALIGGLITDHILFAGYNYKPSVIADAAPGAACCVVSYLPSEERPSGFLTAAMHVPWWHWPFVVVLVVTLACGLTQRIRRRWFSSESESKSESK